MRQLFARCALFSIAVPLAFAPIVRGRDLSLASTLAASVTSVAESSPALSWLYRASTITQILMLFGLTLALLALKGRGAGHDRRLLIAALLFLVGNHGVNALLALHPGMPHRVVYSGALIFVLVAGAQVAQERASVAQAAALVRDALAFIVVVGLLALPVAPNAVIQSGYGGGLLPFRYWGVAGHANSMGAMAALLILLAYAFPYSRRAVQRGVVAAALVSMLLAQSKTAIVGLVVILTYMYFEFGGGALRRKPNVSALVLYSGVFLLGVGAVGMASQLSLNAFELAEVWAGSPQGQEILSLTNRTRIWALAVDTWLRAPLFGYGNEAFGVEHRHEIRMPFALHAHNQYLHSLAAAGLVGLFSLLAFLLVLGRRSFDLAPASRGATVGIFLFILVRTLTEVPIDLKTPITADNLVLLGLIYVCACGARQAAPRRLPQAALGAA